jgi:3-deoxy-D-manno-octulosonic-acid transferase
MDSTDPDFFNPRESDYAHKVYGGTWRSQRNAFPLETVRGIYQSQRKEANSQQPTANSQEADVLIIDCFGLLSSIYHYATVTYVGGGFGEGIHNTLEAAVWGVPVIFGPNNQRFQEAQGLKDCGGGYEIKDAADFNRVMQRFLDEPQSLEKASKEAGDFVSQRVGATDRILSCVQLY